MHMTSWSIRAIFEKIFYAKRKMDMTSTKPQTKLAVQSNDRKNHVLKWWGWLAGHPAQRLFLVYSF